MFEYFPSNYPWSLGVALSISMGGDITEIDNACRPLARVVEGASTAVSTEAWFQSWSKEGQKLEGLGHADHLLGRRYSAGEKYVRASNYFLLAERNMPWSDPRRLATYNKALELFDNGTRLRGDRVERVEVPYEDSTLAGYLLLPEGEGPFPCVVFYNGFDSIKEMHYLMFGREARQRGVAVLFVDQEGTGEAMRLKNLVKRHDSEVSAGCFLDTLEQHSRIDNDRIGIIGLSAGGYDAPRAAAFEKRFKCVACVGAFYNFSDYLGLYGLGEEKEVSVGVSDLNDHLRKVMGKPDLMDAVKAFARRDLTGVLDKITVPFLIMHGENDRQVPLWHAERSIEEAVNSPKAELKVFTLTEGSSEHCGIDTISLHAQYTFDWMAEQLGGSTTCQL